MFDKEVGYLSTMSWVICHILCLYISILLILINPLLYRATPHGFLYSYGVPRQALYRRVCGSPLPRPRKRLRDWRMCRCKITLTLREQVTRETKDQSKKFYRLLTIEIYEWNRMLRGPIVSKIRVGRTAIGSRPDNCIA